MKMMERRRVIMTQGGGHPEPVHGTWADLFRAIDEGTYASEYSVGEVFPLDLGTEGVVNAQIAGFNKDAQADGTGNAPVSFITQYVLTSTHRFNPNLAGETGERTEGTGTIGGWPQSEIRTWLDTYVKPLFPANILGRMVQVTKYSRGYTTAEANNNNISSDDYLWVPSNKEVNNTNESSHATHYSQLFTSTSAKIRTSPNGTARLWGLRSANSTSQFKSMTASGGGRSDGVTTSVRWVVGFCIA